MALIALPVTKEIAPIAVVIIVDVQAADVNQNPTIVGFFIKIVKPFGFPSTILFRIPYPILYF